MDLPNLWLCRGCALGRNWWTASALDVVHSKGKGKSKGKAPKNRTVAMRFLQSLYRHLTMFARSPHCAHAICTIMRASYEHRADIIRCPYGTRSRSTSSLVYHHSSRWNDRDDDAVNRCLTCEACEPEAAVVAGSEETRLSGCCHPLGRSEAASAAKKAHDMGKALVIAACHSWPLRHSHARADARVTRRLQVFSAHKTGDVLRDAWLCRTAYREESRGQTTAIARLKAGHYSSVPGWTQSLPYAHHMIIMRCP